MISAADPASASVPTLDPGSNLGALPLSALPTLREGRVRSDAFPGDAFVVNPRAGGTGA